MQKRARLRLFLLLLIAMEMTAQSSMGQKDGVLGYWKEPQGSVIHVDACGRDVCATLVDLSPSAPARVDGNNPDPNQRHRPLCGLRIGEGFHLVSPDKAEGGSLYDPKSGRTYRGVMKASGMQMDLRGYIGIALFGRTERWTRTEKAATCIDQ